MQWKIAFYLILWCLKKKDWGRRSWYSAFLDISGKCKTSSKCQCRQLSNKKMLVFQPRNWLKSFVWDTWHIRIGIHVQIREKKNKFNFPQHDCCLAEQWLYFMLWNVKAQWRNNFARDENNKMMYFCSCV